MKWHEHRAPKIGDDIAWTAYITKENAELRDKELLR